MKKLFFLVLLFLSTGLLAQKVVVLQHLGTATLFSTNDPFTDAYNASVAGDTIYLPGGVFPGLSINRKLTIFGAGHYPDSTSVTGVSKINGSINLLQGADKTSLQGLWATGNLTFENNKKIDSVVISKCNISNLYINGENRPADNCTGILIYQNVINSIHIPHSSGARLFNNILRVLFYSGTNSWIRNNKIEGVYYFTYALFENNSIIGLSTGVDFNTYRNNIFPFTQVADNSTWIDNYYSVNFSNLFVNATAWFNYSDNYHLNLPGTYPGTDATQAGLYGGFYPYKEGAVPSNPHVQSKTIPLQTNPSGQLNIQVQVAAQNN